MTKKILFRGIPEQVSSEQIGAMFPIDIDRQEDGKIVQGVQTVTGYDPGTGLNALRVIMIPGGSPGWVRDTTAASNDKAYTVPTGKIWIPKTIAAYLNASANVGNRELTVAIRQTSSSGDVQIWKEAVAAASTSAQIFVNGSESRSTTVSTCPVNPVITPSHQANFPMPELMLAEGYTIRAYDRANIDAAGDALYLVIHYLEIDAE